jgi:hypothetical protein
MKKSTAKQLHAITETAKQVESLYNEHNPTDAYDLLDKLVELIDNVTEELGNEYSNDFDYEKEREEYEKSEKYALAVKNNLVLQRKPVDK